MPRKLTACTECQRRRQKCVVKRPDGICTNCSKRFPPVDCTRAVKSSSVASKDCDDTASLEAPPSGLPPALVPDPWNWKDWAPHLALPVRGIDASSVGLLSDDELEQTREDVLVLRRARSNLILDGRGDHRALRSFGGIIMEVITLNGSPLAYTARNTELLHFYLRFVAPNLTSIDGESQPLVFRRGVLPWQLQSPLFPNIAILMACTTQSLDCGIEIQTNPETLAMKARVLSYINAFLTRAGKSNFPEIAAESIKCVINLMVMEWFWGADDSMWAHARGIKEMIRLAGGIRGLQDPVAEGILILTDYEIACCFEDELQWQEGDCASPEEIVVPKTWTEGFDSPLIPSAMTFEGNRVCLGLSSEAARVLDDVRFLTVSIAWPTTPELESDSKIRSTAAWLHTRLKGMTPPETGSTQDEQCLMLETIRLAGLIYSWSIMSLAHTSQFPEGSIKDELYAAMRGVSLRRWKKTPGIFLWVMLVLCPGSISDKRGRFIRRKMAVAGLSIGFEDFPLGISFLRAFWLVQRWIAMASHNGGEQTQMPVQPWPIGQVSRYDDKAVVVTPIDNDENGNGTSRL